MVIEKIVLNPHRNVTLTAFLQKVGGEFHNIPKRPAILVIPGGGYRMCSDREAEPVALHYLQAGYQAFVLRYSVQEHATWPNPLDDYEQAMALIRSKADEWKLYPDKVAVIGFSAGGHLAAAAATLAKNKPNAAILGYPVTEEIAARGCEPTAPDVVSAVDGHTCPCFLFATRTDNLVPISNTVSFMQALTEHGVGFESHIYSYGPHGFSSANSAIMTPGTDISHRAANWVSDSIEWLKEVLGDFGTGSMTPPKYGRRINDDYEKFLSVDCTMEYLTGNEQIMTVLAPLMAAALDAAEGPHYERLELGAKPTLRDELIYNSVPEDLVEQIDQALKKIPNPRI